MPIALSIHGTAKLDLRESVDYKTGKLLYDVLDRSVRRAKEMRLTDGAIKVLIDVPSIAQPSFRYPILLMGQFQSALPTKPRSIQSFFALIQPYRASINDLLLVDGQLQLRNDNKPLRYIVRDKITQINGDLARAHMRGPKCVPLIFLQDITKADFDTFAERNKYEPSDYSGVLFKDCATTNIFRAIARTLTDDTGTIDQIRHVPLSDISEAFLPANVLSASETKVKNIILTETLPKEIDEQLGQREIVIQGAGGTGKTVLLLKTAYEVSQRPPTFDGAEAASLSPHRKILILTYNHALKTNLTRILSYIGFGVADQRRLSPQIRFKTLDKHLKDLMLAFKAITYADSRELFSNSRFAGAFDNLVVKINETDPAPLDSGGKPLTDVLIKESEYYDLVCIDEAQDVRSQERDLLVRLYSPRRVMAAIGLGQHRRVKTTVDEVERVWLLENPDRYIHQLKVSRRMPARLAQFLNRFAAHYKIPEWTATPNDDPDDGELILADLPYSHFPNMHRVLAPERITSPEGIAADVPFDMLVCTHVRNALYEPDMLFGFDGAADKIYTPPPLIDWLQSLQQHAREPGEERPVLIDLIDPKQRKAELSLSLDTLNKIRVVPYESCRGLEGAVVVLDSLDEFFYTNCNEFEKYDKRSPEDARREAARLVAIALSRTTKTLVITFRDPKSGFAQSLQDIAKVVAPGSEVFAVDSDWSDEASENYADA